MIVRARQSAKIVFEGIEQKGSFPHNSLQVLITPFPHCRHTPRSSLCGAQRALVS